MTGYSVKDLVARESVGKYKSGCGRILIEKEKDHKWLVHVNGEEWGRWHEKDCWPYPDEKWVLPFRSLREARDALDAALDWETWRAIIKDAHPTIVEQSKGNNDNK